MWQAFTPGSSDPDAECENDEDEQVMQPLVCDQGPIEHPHPPPVSQAAVPVLDLEPPETPVDRKVGKEQDGQPGPGDLEYQKHGNEGKNVGNAMDQ